MATWQRTLDRAGITDPRLRADYTGVRRLVAAFERGPYTAVRLLLPDSAVPHVIAATGFMHHSDTILDRGPLDGRVAGFTEWEKRVRTALETGEASGDPVLGPFLHTAGVHPRLRHQAEEYLAAAPRELHFDGFATEADYQAYVDGYSLPGFLLVACLLGPGTDSGGYEEFVTGARTFVEAWQRLDFLDDLAEDLREENRLGLPADALARHGVTRSDLAAGRATDGFRGLVQDVADRIRPGLRASHTLLGLVPEGSRPFVRALVTLQEIRLRAVEKRGTALLHGPAPTASPAALRVLAREYRRARALRRRH